MANATIPKRYRYSKLECMLLDALQQQWIRAVIIRQQQKNKAEATSRRFRERRAEQRSYALSLRKSS